MRLRMRGQANGAIYFRITTIKQYDIVVSTVGAAGLIESKHLQENHTLIVDTGFIPLENAKKLTSDNVKGDVDPSAKKNTQFITPVPGGTGPIEMAVLIERVAKLYDIEVPSWKVILAEGEDKDTNAMLKLKVKFNQ
jgi:methylenetetrahydrofolate dehydrogenase (NADP+)/methenyltetrahydrofolate cyclohydrolase